MRSDVVALVCVPAVFDLSTFFRVCTDVLQRCVHLDASEFMTRVLLRLPELNHYCYSALFRAGGSFAKLGLRMIMQLMRSDDFAARNRLQLLRPAVLSTRPLSVYDADAARPDLPFGADAPPLLYSVLSALWVDGSGAIRVGPWSMLTDTKLLERFQRLIHTQMEHCALADLWMCATAPLLSHVPTCEQDPCWVILQQLLKCVRRRRFVPSQRADEVLSASGLQHATQCKQSGVCFSHRL